MSLGSLAPRVLQGDIRAASRLMRRIDDGDVRATADLQAIFPHTGGAYVIGVTGPPGAGKSTITDRLIAAYRKQNLRVGVLAVDPTSPFTGGAILGDRIRMQEHSTDDHVFIRSLATRGNLGGLSRATADCLRVMDAMGHDVVIIETVGVGQDEIDIAQLAHTTIVVLVPGMGDDIQAIKAGILEVADIFAINKSDLAGADRVVRELRAMLEMRHVTQNLTHDIHHTMSGESPQAKVGDRQPVDWEPPIQKMIAARNEGIEALVDSIAAHRTHLDDSGDRTVRDRNRALVQFLALLRERLLKAALERLERRRGTLGDVANRIALREADPYALADELADQMGIEDA